MMELHDASTWEPWHFVAYGSVVLLGMEILAFLVNHLDLFFHGRIPPGGKPLEAFGKKDMLFIAINKVTTMFFTYHVIRFAHTSPHVEWDFGRLTLWNTVGAYFAFHVLYDLIYCWFHRILHIRALYPYVHKHHHRQVVPFRGNLDAINVHPFEFASGEYLHLLCIYLVPCHILTVALFIILGGIMASLNHTRFDASVDSIYQVKYHDVHHRIPDTNYGQYIMLWDHVFGSFRPYNKEEAAAEKAG